MHSRYQYTLKIELDMNYICGTTDTSGSLKPRTEVPSGRLMVKLPATRPFAAAVYKISLHTSWLGESPYHIEQGP